jgi:hypothetical protein
MATTKDKVYQKLLSQEWVKNYELAMLFPQGSKGFLSWSQRLREIRAEQTKLGGGIKVRHDKGGTYSYHLVKPEQNGQIKFY